MSSSNPATKKISVTRCATPKAGRPRPTNAAAKIEVHPDFDLTLVAAEPLITKAMNIDWDEKGRLWVSETPEYPNGRRVPNTAPWRDTRLAQAWCRSRAAATRSRGHDLHPHRHRTATASWTASTSSLTSSSSSPASSSTRTASSRRRRRTSGISRTPTATKRRQAQKLYTGLGNVDTHAVINNLRWGLDGWIYATHGYSGGAVTSPDGTKNFGRDGSGVVRFKPDGSAIEQYQQHGGNTWGLDITGDGQVFWTQPTSGTVFFHTVLPESRARARPAGRHDVVEGHDHATRRRIPRCHGPNRPTCRSIRWASSRPPPAAPSTTAARGRRSGATATSPPSRRSTSSTTSS